MRKSMLAVAIAAALSSSASAEHQPTIIADTLNGPEEWCGFGWIAPGPGEQLIVLPEPAPCTIFSDGFE